MKKIRFKIIIFQFLFVLSFFILYFADSIAAQDDSFLQPPDYKTVYETLKDIIQEEKNISNSYKNEKNKNRFSVFKKDKNKESNTVTEENSKNNNTDLNKRETEKSNNKIKVITNKVLKILNDILVFIIKIIYHLRFILLLIIIIILVVLFFKFNENIYSDKFFNKKKNTDANINNKRKYNVVNKNDNKNNDNNDKNNNRDDDSYTIEHLKIEDAVKDKDFFKNIYSLINKGLYSNSLIILYRYYVYYISKKLLLNDYKKYTDFELLDFLKKAIQDNKLHFDTDFQNYFQEPYMVEIFKKFQMFIFGKRTIDKEFLLYVLSLAEILNEKY